MTLRLLTLIALLVGSVLAAPLPFPKPVKNKPASALPDAMQGLWEVKTRTGPNGLNFAISITQKYVKIDRTTWTFLRADKTTTGMQCSLTINPNQKPAHLDLGFPMAIGVGAINGINAAGPYMTGIVEVQGDTMKFCYALRTDRPNDFKPANPREYLYTLERVKTP
ncbi:MAG: hypothetical protein EBV06_11240 [Planctomycetia bacterium]|nr:hypothetical protein [Planctomycetia bacterium]